jgi:hypothetical protein
MGRNVGWAVSGLVGMALGGCGPEPGAASVESRWAALQADGDLSAIAPGSGAPPAMTLPPRFCDDCSRAPLALWAFDDCNMQSTELADTAFTTSISHPAFRAVSAACAAGQDGQAIKISRNDDIVYAPDQPDFVFDQGLTIAAWINPDSVNGTQSIVRKRFDGTSSFTLAIDDRKLTFLLRLTNGKTVGVTAPIKAKRFTHVAATYDGKEALLYLDGAPAARTKTNGKIAPGAGPILIGNDADGRQMKGLVDSVWLNTLAAPADAIAGLTCLRRNPIVSLSPATTPPQIAGATVQFDLSVTNPSSATCPVDPFPFFLSLPFPLAPAESSSGAILLFPGQTDHATFGVKSSRMAAVGSYAFQAFVFNVRAQQFQATAEATYVVGTGPVACDGIPPQTPIVIGSPSSPAGAPFTYAAPGLAPPTAVQVSPDGAVQVSANPGTSTDPANAFLGFGFGFGNPPCVDASAYNAVRFTITGDLGTCALAVSLVPSQDNSVAFGPFGTCTLGNDCHTPFSGPIGVGTTVVHFTEMTGGNPLDGVDPTALNDISWNLTVPTDGVAAPCVANFTVSDVTFVVD